MPCAITLPIQSYKNSVDPDELRIGLPEKSVRRSAASYGKALENMAVLWIAGILAIVGPIVGCWPLFFAGFCLLIIMVSLRAEMHGSEW